MRSLAVSVKRRVSETIFSKVGFAIPLFNHRSSGKFNESERQRVHAITESGWFGAVVEDMAQMRVTQSARNRCTSHIERRVGAFVHILLGNWLPEAGPA